MDIKMKANPKCNHTGLGLYVLVHNYSNLNEVGNYYYYSDKIHTEKDYYGETINVNAIGRWIPKNIKT